MKKTLFLLVFLVSAAAHADDKKVCIYIGAKKLEFYEKDNYRLAYFYCKDGQEDGFDENNRYTSENDYPLDKVKDNIFSIKYLKMSKVIKVINFKMAVRHLGFEVKQYSPKLTDALAIKEAQERDRIEKKRAIYKYEQRFLIKDLSIADEIQIFKGKKLVISDKINFDYYKGD